MASASLGFGKDWTPEPGVFLHNVRMPETLLRTKLFVPPLRPSLVARPSLIERLNRVLQPSVKLALVSAPAGFGKTTLIVHWSRQMAASEAWRLAWFSLDENDNDLGRFFTYLITALRKIDGPLGQSALELLQSPQATNIRVVLTDLLNTLAQSTQAIVLTLDDYHLITNRAVHEGISFLFENAPPNFRLVLISRVDPPFSLARLRARHEMTEIRQDDLRFARPETTEFLNQLMALNLQESAIAALEQRTEGWVAGLQMAALSMQGQADIDNFIIGFTGSHRYIFDYLAEEVLSRRPTGTRDFLLKTAVLDRMCANLCESLTSNPQSQQILEQLEAANLFLVPLDDERRWYRYHHLFADLLRQQLRQEMPEMESLLHGRAGRWFADAGYTHEAIEHDLKAGEFERAAALMEPLAHGMAYRMETEILGRWVQALPDDLLLQYPGIVFPYAVVMSVTSRFDEYDRLLEKSEQAALANIDKREAQIILGQVGIHKSIRLHLFGGYERALQQVANAQTILRQYDQPDERWELISIVGYGTLQTRGQVKTALADLDRATRLGTEDEGSIGALLCNTFTANAYFYLGQLHQAEQSLQRAVEAVTMPDGTKLSHAVFTSALLARLAYERNELDEAARFVDAYLPLTDITGFTKDPVDTLFVGMMLPLAQGDPDSAIAVLKHAEQQFQTFPISATFTLRLAAIKALLWLHLGNLQLAAQWSDSVEMPEGNGRIQPILAFPYLVWSRIRLAQHQFDRVDTFLAQLRGWAEHVKLGGIRLETAVLQALSAHAQNDTPTALTHIKTALIPAALEGYARLFLDEG